MLPPAFVGVQLQQMKQIIADRQQPSLVELALPDMECASQQIDISQCEIKRFADAKASAIQQQ